MMGFGTTIMIQIQFTFFFSGFVYWTDWGSEASIERISMDGMKDTRRKLVTTDIRWPNGLSLDLSQTKVSI